MMTMDHLDVAKVQHHTIAYSGGIDSSLVALLVHLNQHPSDKVQAVLGVSPAVSQEQIKIAEQVATHIGIDLIQVPTTEGSDPIYIANAGKACLACKTHLYSALKAVVEHTVDQPTQKLYNGTNMDDLQDPTRLGLVAAANFSVHSPLEILTKEQVRQVAKHLGLPNWNYAASPCLRSRLALGVPAMKDDLQRIERAEKYAREQLRVHITTNLRVRLLSGNRACIEVDNGEFLEKARAMEWRVLLGDGFHFDAVECRAFKSGSVAVEKGDLS